ncbi:MAG TPA: hypothetical protein GXZ69_09900 [Spirochaetales bacterium]|nr:hypothetical protein [Spirochaetales bacterium]
MKNKRKPFGLLLIGILLLLMWGTGCTTSLGLGLGFGSGGTSLALGVSTTLPREEKTDMWEMQGFSLPKKAGEQVTLTFPKGGSAKGKVWGTDLYAEKSTIGMAAVHSGLITFEDGGTVTVRREEKTRGFRGSFRNGIESLSSDKRYHAFSFVREDGR